MSDAFGHIQWKGTDVCIDLTCECGEQQHLDAEFLYEWECPSCHTSWVLVPFITLFKGSLDEYWATQGAPDE